MNTIFIKIISVGALFLLTIASGIWVHKMGRPLNTLVFTIHKLIFISTVGYTGHTIYIFMKGIERSGLLVTGLVVSAVFILGLIVTGILLSTGKPIPPIVHLLHKGISPLAFLSVGLTLYILLGKK